MNIDSAKLFKDFEAAGEEVKQEIRLRTGLTGSVHLTFWFGYNKPYFSLEYSAYPMEEKVKGVHLADMVDELCRRLNFVSQQETLQLAAPIIEAVVVQPPAPPVSPDDEIPF